MRSHPLVDEVHHSFGNDTCFSRAGSRQNEYRTVSGPHRFRLLWIEMVQGHLAEFETSTHRLGRLE